MFLCPMCGLQNQTEVCLHHVYGDDDWAAGNKIMCDFFHRGRRPRRLRKDDREGCSITELDPE